MDGLPKADVGWPAAPRGAGVSSSRFQPLLIAAPLTCTVALGALLYSRGGEGARGLPGPYPTLAYMLLMKLEQLSERQDVRPYGSRQETARPRTDGAAIPHIGS